MKITKERLREIIKEEISGVMTEDPTMDHMTAENFIAVLQALIPLFAVGGLGAMLSTLVQKLVGDSGKVEKAIESVKSNQTPEGM